MNLNYTAFFLISFVPLLIAVLWYHPKIPLVKWAKLEEISPLYKQSFIKWIFLFLLSLTIVYGYMNLIIHQMGFYELFFTDIMQGSEEAKQITQEFLSVYGDKHRHFGHGVFHGVINAFVFAGPFIGIHAIIENKSKRYFIFNFTYWLLTSMLIGGLISEFV